MSHRLFFGIRPSEAVRDALLDTMEDVENARWQDDDQLHLTLLFIGEVDIHRADDLAEAASRIAFESFDVRIRGCATFAKKGIPRILYARVEDSEPLDRLYRKLGRLAERCGIEVEARKFVPHITLARLNASSGPTGRFLARHADLALGPWHVDSYMLFESHLREHGSLYQPVVTYPARTQ